MIVKAIDRERGRFSCELGEFTEFPTEPVDGPLPKLVSFSRWSPPGERIRNSGVDYIIVRHEGEDWRYRLEPASSVYPAETIPAFYEQAEMFDVGILVGPLEEFRPTNPDTGEVVR